MKHENNIKQNLTLTEGKGVCEGAQEINEMNSKRFR